jgi:AAA+ superfamily predicted ATPase
MLADREDRFSLNLLFHGLPGAGKTEFARYLADTLDRKLIQKRADAILLDEVYSGVLVCCTNLLKNLEIYTLG